MGGHANFSSMEGGIGGLGGAYFMGNMNSQFQPRTMNNKLAPREEG